VSATDSYKPAKTAIDVEAILRLLEGRLKLVILFHLFVSGEVQRLSDLEERVTGVASEVLTQQLRQLEDDGIVMRTACPQVSPQFGYRLTDWGLLLCPALAALLAWAERRDDFKPPASSVTSSSQDS